MPDQDESQRSASETQVPKKDPAPASGTVEPRARPQGQIVATRAEFHGPLPPPDVLRGYEQLLPGAADRLLQLVEREAAHRHSVEQKFVTSSFDEKARGQRFGLVIGVVAIIAGAIVSIAGQPWAGAIIGGSGVAGIVAVFVLGRSSDEGPEPKVEGPKPRSGE